MIKRTDIEQVMTEEFAKLRKERDEARAEVAQMRNGELARTPDGTGLCFLHDGVLILLGYPVDEDHNCDAMGCSSVSHVVQRKQLTPEQLDRLRAGERVGLSGLGKKEEQP